MAGTHALRGDEPLFRPFVSGDILILQLLSDPTPDNYASKQHEYNRLIAQIDKLGLKHVIYDLSRVKLVDSIVVGMMSGITLRLRGQDGDAVVAGMSPDVRELFATLMLLENEKKRAIWKAYPTVSRAVERFPWPKTKDASGSHRRPDVPTDERREVSEMHPRR